MEKYQATSDMAMYQRSFRASYESWGANTSGRRRELTLKTVDSERRKSGNPGGEFGIWKIKMNFEKLSGGAQAGFKDQGSPRTAGKFFRAVVREIGYFFVIGIIEIAIKVSGEIFNV